MPSRGAVAAVLIVGIGVASCSTDGPSDLAERQQQVAAAGAQVMPFDLDATTHVFEKTSNGGVQRVQADVAGDTEQIALIRHHLDEEAAKFRVGDFSDPAAIHGAEMPGLAVLEARSDEYSVSVETIDDGALIRYSTSDPDLVEALHDWFDAQVSDHGSHAQMSG